MLSEAKHLNRSMSDVGCRMSNVKKAVLRSKFRHPIFDIPHSTFHIPHPTSHIRHRALLAFAILCTIPIRPASAHQGPPFPILMDVHTARHVVSVWADPDIGEATFFVIIESPDGGPTHDEPTVSMWAEPVSGRLPRKIYPAQNQNMRNRVQFEARPEFDQRDQWNVGFRIETPGAEPEEVTTQIESTPPGLGPWDLVIYLFPFVLIGALWTLGMLKRRRRPSPIQSQ